MKQSQNCAQHFIEDREERKRESCVLECHEDEDVASHERKACSTFSGDIKERIMLRREEITRLLKHSTDDEDLYKECFERFIDMEENFII